MDTETRSLRVEEQTPLVRSLLELLETQRFRIFEVMGALSCAIKFIEVEAEPGKPDPHNAVRLAHSALDNIAEDLEAKPFLRWAQDLVERKENERRLGLTAVKLSS